MHAGELCSNESMPLANVLPASQEAHPREIRMRTGTHRNALSNITYSVVPAKLVGISTALGARRYCT
jgi:hypothetical protein